MHRGGGSTAVLELEVEGVGEEGGEGGGGVGGPRGAEQLQVRPPASQQRRCCGGEELEVGGIPAGVRRRVLGEKRAQLRLDGGGGEVQLLEPRHGGT